MPDKTPQPWPDLTRPFAIAAIFVLVWRIFEMIRVQPALAENQGFMLLAQAVVVSGLVGGVIAFLFTASKTNESKDKTMVAQAEALKAASDPAWQNNVKAEEVKVEGDQVNVQKKDGSDDQRVPD